MTAGIEPAHLLSVADIVHGALIPHVDDDWSVKAGPLEWDVERTITHMIGATAKYTLYLASASKIFIALTCSRFEDAGHAELLASIKPVATALANVAGWTPPGTTGFHARGQTTGEGFLSMACVELLIHTDDALRGMGDRLHPPDDLVLAVLRAEYPEEESRGSPWPALIRATGRDPEFSTS